MEQPASDLFALKAQWFPEEKNAAASPVAPGQDSARAHLTFVAEKAPCEIGTKLREARVTFRITETDGAKRTADLPLVVKIVEAFHPLLITGTEVTIGPDGWGQVQVVNPNPVALPYYHAVMECADDCRRKPGESGSFSDYISYAGPALGKDGFPPGESALSFQTVSPSQLPAANCSCIARFFAATYLEHCPSNEQEVKVTLKR